MSTPEPSHPLQPIAEPTRIGESFLRGVVAATTGYSQGWREVAARLLWAEHQITRLRTEGEADSRAADLHRRLNQGVSDALGQPFGATWHDLPEKVVALTQQLSTLQQQIDEMVSVLKPACDRTWEHETPIQVAHIAANAIHWRDAEIQQLQQQIDERDRRIAQLTAVAHEAAIGYAKQSARAEAAEQQIDTLTQDNETLRRMLWLNHGCPTDALYGDDGEMQCPCPVDFKREAPEVIEQRWRDRNLAAYRRHHQEEPGS